MSFNIVDLKMQALEERQDLERLVEFYEQFQRYVTILAHDIEVGAISPQFVAAQASLRLRLSDEEPRFLEWWDGDQFLNPGISGLIDNFEPYFHNRESVSNDLLTATAKFEHLIMRKHRDLRELHEKIALLASEQEAQNLTKMEKRPDSSIAEKVKNADQVGEVGLKWAGRLIQFGAWAQKILSGLGLF